MDYLWILPAAAALGIPIIILVVKGWMEKADAAAVDKAKATADAWAKEAASFHDSLKLQGMKIDKLTEKHESDVEKIHQLELALADRVKREELNELYGHIDKFKTDIIQALASGKGSHS